MDDVEMEGPGVDEVLLEVLQALVQKAKGKRAESVLKPTTAPSVAVEAPGGNDDEMAELEQMLADPSLQEAPSEENELPADALKKDEEDDEEA